MWDTPTDGVLFHLCRETLSSDGNSFTGDKLTAKGGNEGGLYSSWNKLRWLGSVPFDNYFGSD